MATRSLTYHRPWLYPKQRDAIFNPARYAICEASTKSGKTVGCLAWLAEQAFRGRRGQAFWWVAPTYAQTKIAYRRLQRALPAGTAQAHDTDLTLTLPHGPVLWFKTAEKPDALYGEDVYAAVLDEATRAREEAWHALRSTLTATHGPARLIGNVKGRRNWAYRLARRVEQGLLPDWHYARLTAADAVAAGILTAAEVADAARLLPAAVYRELYEAEPSDDAGNPFGYAAIHACIADTLAPPEPGHDYVMGLDLAKSVDYTVAIVIDRATKAVVAMERWQSPWDVTMRRVQSIASRYNNAHILADQTGLGDPIVEQLQRMPYL